MTITIVTSASDTKWLGFQMEQKYRTHQDTEAFTRYREIFINEQFSDGHKANSIQIGS